MTNKHRTPFSSLFLTVYIDPQARSFSFIKQTKAKSKKQKAKQTNNKGYLSEEEEEKRER